MKRNRDVSRNKRTASRVAECVDNIVDMIGTACGILTKHVIGVRFSIRIGDIFIVRHISKKGKQVKREEEK